MPKVETVQGPSIAANPIQDRMQNLDARGTGISEIGKTVSGAGNDLHKIMEQRRLQDDEAIVKAKGNELRQKINQRGYLDDDAYYNRQGKDAYDGYEPLTKELKEYSKQLSDGMTPRQQRLYGNVANQYLNAESEAMSRHAAAGRKKWYNDQDAALIVQAQEDGSLRWNNNEAYATQIRASIQNMAKRNGLPPEMVEVKTNEALTAMHVNALDNMLETAPESAEAYFTKHFDEIDASMHDEITAKIKTRNDAGWVQIQSDIIRSAGGSRTERLEKARELAGDDPDKRKLLVAQVTYDMGQENSAETEARSDAWQKLGSLAATGQMAPADIQATYKEEWAVLSPEQKKSIMSGVARKTDLQTYYTAKGLINNTPSKAREYVVNNLHKFSDTDAKKLLDLITQAPPEKPKAFSDSSAFGTAMELVLGKEPSSDGKNRKDWNRKFNILSGMYQESLDEWLDENPNMKKVPAQERDKILNQFKLKLLRKDYGPLGLDFLNPDESADFDSIPAEDLEGIRNALLSQGVDATPQNILKVYLEKK